MVHERSPIPGDTIDGGEQFAHTRDYRDLRPHARSQEAVVMRTQPRVFRRTKVGINSLCRRRAFPSGRPRAPENERLPDCRKRDPTLA